MRKTRGLSRGKKSTKGKGIHPQSQRQYKTKSVNQLQEEERTMQKYMVKYQESAPSANMQEPILRQEHPSLAKKELSSQVQQNLLSFPKGDVLSWQEQNSEPSIEAAFKILDRLSILLNGPQDQITQRAFDDLFALVERVKVEMPLEHIHNMQYTNRLAYIAAVSKQRLEGQLSVRRLKEVVKEQLARVEGLYSRQFQNWRFLDRIMREYSGQT